MFQESGVVDFSVLLEGNVSHLYLRLDELHLGLVLIVFGVVVCNDQLERKVVDVLMSMQHVTNLFRTVFS